MVDFVNQTNGHFFKVISFKVNFDKLQRMQEFFTIGLQNEKLYVGLKIYF